jgi:hypothetical protein
VYNVDVHCHKPFSRTTPYVAVVTAQYSEPIFDGEEVFSIEHSVEVARVYGRTAQDARISAGILINKNVLVGY